MKNSLSEETMIYMSRNEEKMKLKSLITCYFMTNCHICDICHSDSNNDQMIRMERQKILKRLIPRMSISV